METTTAVYFGVVISFLVMLGIVWAIAYFRDKWLREEREK